MKLKLNRAVAFAAATLLGLGGLVAGATAANAATGSLILPNGTGASTFNIKTSQACSAGATNFRATISAPAVTGGSAAWNNIVLVGNTPIATFGDLVASGAPIANSLDALAQTAGVKFDPNTYTITGFCQNNLGTTTFDTFTATIITTGAIGALANPFTFQAPAAPASTTTLAVAPASPVALGTNVTLTATVTSTAPVAGSVNFLDGTTVLGSGTVGATGTATFSTTTLAGGTHSITAAFVPTNPLSIAASTSAASSFTVTVPATTTTTTLTFSPAAPTTADPLVLTATVAPSTAVGTVAFFEGTTQVGSGSVTSGVATATLTGVTAATHNYTATFTPANPANFVTSTSAAVAVTVATFAGFNLNGVSGGGEVITTTIPAGTLTLTAATTTVDLGTVALNAANSLYVATPKDMNPVTVTDTRAGSLGYTVSGIAGDFTSGSNKINSENLGWAPKIVTPGVGVTATPGTAVPAGSGVAVGAVSNPIQGLKASRTLGTAATGASVGTVVFGATLSLTAPTTTPPGTYSTTLVITAI